MVEERVGEYRSEPVWQPRSARKWRLIGLLWAAQTALVVLFVPILDLLTSITWTAGTVSVPWLTFWRYFDDAEYVIWVGVYVLVVTALQAGFLVGIARPLKKDDPRPSIWRFVACGAAIGVLSGMLCLIALAVLDSFFGPFSTTSWIYPVGSIALAVVVFMIATVVLRHRYRDALPVHVSLMFAVFLSGMLVLGAVLIVMDGVEYARDLANVTDPEFPEWVWALMGFGAPLAGWVVFTPLVVSFAKRGPVESQASRLANRIFIGTIIEVVVTIPLFAMIRRRSSCFCSEGTFWALILCGSIGLITMGPAIYLLPLGRGRRRIAAGSCPACGHDLRGIPRADRCPKCGAGCRCLSCGYDMIAVPNATTCPECGSPWKVDPAGPYAV